VTKKMLAPKAGTSIFSTLNPVYYVQN